MFEQISSLFRFFLLSFHYEAKLCILWSVSGFRIKPGLTSIHRKCLSCNSIQQKLLSYKSIHQVNGENACHTIFIHFRKTIEKKLNHFCGFLTTVEQTGEKKNWFKIFFFAKNDFHRISIYGNLITGIFLGRRKSNFENLP